MCDTILSCSKMKRKTQMEMTLHCMASGQGSHKSPRGPPLAQPPLHLAHSPAHSRAEFLKSSAELAGPRAGIPGARVGLAGQEGSRQRELLKHCGGSQGNAGLRQTRHRQGAGQGLRGQVTAPPGPPTTGPGRATGHSTPGLRIGGSLAPKAQWSAG